MAPKFHALSPPLGAHKLLIAPIRIDCYEQSDMKLLYPGNQ